MKDWIGNNTVRITALVTAVIALLLGFEVIDWSQEQVALVLGLLAAVLVFFVSPTVTANTRIGDGTMFGGFTGKGE